MAARPLGALWPWVPQPGSGGDIVGTMLWGRELTWSSQGVGPVPKGWVSPCPAWPCLRPLRLPALPLQHWTRSCPLTLCSWGTPRISPPFPLGGTQGRAQRDGEARAGSVPRPVLFPLGNSHHISDSVAPNKDFIWQQQAGIVMNRSLFMYFLIFPPPPKLNSCVGNGEWRLV